MKFPKFFDFFYSEVQEALRKDLLEHNCQQDLEIIDPTDTVRAARLLHRDGYVIVRDVLPPEAVASVKGLNHKLFIMNTKERSKGITHTKGFMDCFAFEATEEISTSCFQLGAKK